MSLPLAVPTATYRLQFNRGFTFRDAADLVPYLAALGVSHCYASPYLRARPGSMHGYDIVDHNSLNPEIGTAEDYAHFVAELHRHGMGQILDIVPNHMGVMGSDNAWWLDVLENGEASEYAEFFDIDWNPIKDELRGKVLIPVLEDQYGNVLERGDLKLTFDAECGEFSIFYFNHRFPIDPSEYPRILSARAGKMQEQPRSRQEEFLELQSISTAFSHLPKRGHELTAEERAERRQEKEVQKRRLAALVGRSPDIRESIRATVEEINGNPSSPQSFEQLHELIKAQAFRLAQWRVAADDINYRRFFDVNELAALRMENQEVFRKTHQFILDLVAQGRVNGLRIDHPDGLYDPKKYLLQLSGEFAQARPGDEQIDAYVVVEKILTGKERLREDWPIEGTTGYDVANLINGLFVDTTAVSKMERIYRAFAGRREEYSDLTYTCRKLILKVGLASELSVLSNLLSRIALSNRHTCDFTLNALRSALAEIIACFPVYRTYVREGEVSDEDRRLVTRAVGGARRRSNAADLSVFDFVQRILVLDVNGSQSGCYRRAVTRFAMKFQQVTAAVMAKGLEDTAFYRYNRLVSLNEVGGNPAKFGTTLEEFHEANEFRAEHWPHSMLASSTHDSKRSEDVRARINVLSEMPGPWRLSLRKWREWNRSKKSMVDGAIAPTRNDDYLLYQTLLGTWPLAELGEADSKAYTARIEEYMLKAVREAKELTSWANRNEAYENALTKFIRAILEKRAGNRFLEDFGEFQKKIARAGMFNSLSQCLLRMTLPGVPDIYQGNELWDFSLVDPDNRRPVDYELRRQAMGKLPKAGAPRTELRDFAREALPDVRDGSIKMFLMQRALSIRKNAVALFQDGDYTPLTVRGSKANHICAFAREHEGRTAIVAVPRLCASLLGDAFESPCGQALWEGTELEVPRLAAPCVHHAFTGECIAVRNDGLERRLALGEILRDFPVGLLLSEQLPV
ncbi:MAG TPA: malto-oligosyltrehalose synthase [Terriglobales bacterium]|nr:malto-oligosyltrehalose synthase [Terriglobales bacterium]